MSRKRLGIEILGPAMTLVFGFTVGLPKASASDQGPNLLKESARREPHSRGARRPHLRVGVNLALVPVTVTDPMGRIVNGLDEEHFRVLDQGEEQEIVSFSGEDAPISTGLVLDLSGSMSEKLHKARLAVREFFRTLNPKDEVFLTTFSHRPKIRTSFTRRASDVLDGLLFEKAEGRTALIDAIYLSLQHAQKEARFARKALIVVSDGGDNSSRYTMGELKTYAVEAEAQVYAIGIHDNPRTEEELHGRLLLQNIADRTGGRHFSIRNVAELSDIMGKIGVALHNQYVIGYHPPDDLSPGKYRRIRIKLNLPKGLLHFNVYARRGYYAPDF